MHFEKNVYILISENILLTFLASDFCAQALGINTKFTILMSETCDLVSLLETC